MHGRQESRGEQKSCNHGVCGKPEWEEYDYCFWHVKENNKSLYDIDWSISGSRVVAKEAYLRGAKFSGADLSEANLLRADLSEANLSGADLSEANLSWADLSEANLSGASLSGANLSRADLPEANLSGADLSETNIQEAFIGNEPLREQLATIQQKLTGDDQTERARAIDATARLSTERPELCTSFFGPLLQNLDSLTAPSVQISAVRALTTAALETDASIFSADPTLAEFLRNGPEFVRKETAAAVSPVITDYADNFPETVSAFRAALDDDSAEIRLLAAQTLAVITHDHPDVVGDPDALLTELETLRENAFIPDPAIDEVTEIVQRSMGLGGGA